jgi:hypothetical protein
LIVVLGSRLGSIHRWSRCLVVWVSGTVALGAVAALARPTVSQAWADRASLDALPLDRCLADLAGLVLLGCAAWGWLAFTCTVGEVLVAGRGPRSRPGVVRRPGRPWRLPDGVRRVVLAACGVALASGLAQPSFASSSAHRHTPSEVAALSGLPLPERAVAPRRSAPARAQPAGQGGSHHRSAQAVVVRPGDCLWSIAARDLPSDAPPEVVAARWQAIYALNRTVIGPDPDVVVPGQHLVLPTPSRKDLS